MKIYIYNMILVLVAATLLGSQLACKESPSADIVVQKTDMQYVLDENSFLEYSYKEQYSDAYSVVSQYPTKIKIDANVYVPTVEKVPVWKVSFQMLEQSDIDTMLHYFVQDSHLRNCIQQADGSYSMIQTKEDIEKQMMSISAWLDNPSGDAYNDRENNPEDYQAYVDQQKHELENLNELFKNAPSESEIPASTGMLQWADDRESALLMATFINDDDEQCELIASSSMPSKTNQFQFSVLCDYYLAQNTNPYCTTRDGNTSLSIEDARAVVMDCVAKLGIKNMRIDSQGVDRCISKDQGQSSDRYKDCYVFALTPVFSEINCTYVDTTFLSNKTVQRNNMQYAPIWPAEALIIKVTDDGIIELKWNSLFSEQAKEVLCENVELLPFEMIMNQFKEKVGFAGNYLLQAQDSSLERTLHITDVKMGYYRIAAPNRTDEAIYIPVWDFIGFEEIQFVSQDDSEWALDDELKLIRPALGHTFLTINAIDGSIIDRRVGY